MALLAGLPSRQSLMARTSCFLRIASGPRTAELWCSPTQRKPSGLWSWRQLPSGDPTALLVEPQRINTAVTMNFAATNVYKTLRLTVIYPAEDYDNAAGSDDIGYPQEYYAALEWELARRCAPKFGRVWTPDLQGHWQIAVQEGINFNPVDTHLSFEPGRDMTDSQRP